MASGDLTARPLPWGNPGDFPPPPVQLGITFNEYVQDVHLFRRLELVKFEERKAKDIAQIYEGAIQDAVSRALAMDPSSITRTDQLAYAGRLADSWTAATGRSLDELEKGLRQTIAHSKLTTDEISAAWNAYKHHPDFSTLPDWRTPPLEVFENAVRATDESWFLRDLFTGPQQKMIAQARTHVLQAVLQGQSSQQLATELRKSLGLARKDSIVAARTSLHRIQADYHRSWMKANPDIVSRWKYTATLDTRTCPICGPYDGKIYKVGDGPVIPVHFQCRCANIPIPKSVRELMGGEAPSKDPLARDLRESMDGLRPASLTWSEWVKRKEEQLDGFAKGIMGSTRYDAWKSGKIELADLSHNGKIRTLDSLGLEKK